MKIIRERLRLFLLLVLGLIILLTQPLPFRLAGILLSVGALWIGFRLLVLLRALRNRGYRAPGVFTLIVGLSLSGLLLFLLIADAVYYPLVNDLENCEAGANTQQASDICQQAAKDRINDILDRLTQESRGS